MSQSDGEAGEGGTPGAGDGAGGGAGDGAGGGAGPQPPLGRPGRPVNRRSPFFLGMAGAAGVAVTTALAAIIVTVRALIVLIVLALFLAVGLDPFARWLGRFRLRRGPAVLTIGAAVLLVLAGFLSLAIPPLTQQAEQLAHNLPHYLSSLRNTHSLLGRLNERLHLQQTVQRLLTGGGGASLAGGVLGAGRVVLGAVASTLIVAVLTVYFLLGLPRIKATFYRLCPASRRRRVELITEEIFAKVGRYLLGQLMLALIVAVGTLVWLEATGVPYALLLAFFVALLGLIPLVGSTVGGVIVSLVALTVSLPIAGATAGFYTFYRLFEDYVLTPRIMGRQVEVPGMVAIVAVLLGGALLGIPGALLGIPLAAAIRLVLREVFFPRLDAA